MYKKHPLQESAEFVEEAEKELSNVINKVQEQQLRFGALADTAERIAEQQKNQARKQELVSAYNLFTESTVGLMSNVLSMNHSYKFTALRGTVEEDDSINFIRANIETNSNQDNAQISIDQNKIIDAILDDDYVLEQYSRQIKDIEARKSRLLLEDTSKKAYEEWCNKLINSTLDGSEMLPPSLKIELTPYNTWKTDRENYNKKIILSINKELNDAKANFAKEQKIARLSVFDYKKTQDRIHNYHLNSGVSSEATEQIMRSSQNKFDYMIKINRKYAIEYAKQIDHPYASTFIKLMSGKPVDSTWDNSNNSPIPPIFFALSASISGELAKKINAQDSEIKVNPWFRMLLRTGSVMAYQVKNPYVSIGAVLALDFTDAWIGDIDDTKMLKIEESLSNSLQVQREIIKNVANGNDDNLVNMYEAINLSIAVIANDSNTSYPIKKILNEQIVANKAEMLVQVDKIKRSSAPKSTRPSFKT